MTRYSRIEVAFRAASSSFARSSTPNYAFHPKHASSRQRTTIFTAATLDSPKACKLQNAGVEIVRVATWRGVVDLRAVLTELGRREILSVLLEAGPLLNGAALGAGLVDKVTLFYAPKFAGETGVPFAHMPTVPRASLQKLRVQQFGPDFCIEGYLRDAYR
jgi:diaminohydroxyphosphoribosylaminopyrimidine deaminase / 5-amino-6-(5-phosphoribosylamino)uracil reductase